MIGYTKDGPGASQMRTEVPPIFEKLEAQMEANRATHDEIERFIGELNLFGAAAVSFPERRDTFHA
jgi:hypothetical protein